MKSDYSPDNAPLCNGKRSYPSRRDARLAHARAGFRIRTYWCARCRRWHVTANDKR